MLDEKQIKQLSQIGMRGAFGQLMFSYAQNDENIMIVSADLGITSGLTGIMEKLPDQFLNIGIAEQNMIGISTGMVLKGFRVYATSFAPFATARCCEQIRVNLGEMRVPVIIVGIASGFEIEQFGNSHYGYDDIAYMRAISGITILSPADTTELAKMLEALQNYNKPVYLRLTKTTRKGLIYKTDYNYTIGKANIIRESSEIVIVATGSIVATAVKVADEIEKESNISCGVIDVHTIKPFDEECIKEAALKNQLVITLEEHNKIGGLGSAVSETIAKCGSGVKVYCIGVPDEHIFVGDYDFCISSYGLDAESVKKTILNEWEKLHDRRRNSVF